MTDKQLRRLSRTALIELLITQTEENAALKEQVAQLEKIVSQKSLTVSTAGSMAEAALVLNDVFESADSAANQYLENIRQTNARCEAIVERANRQAEEIVREANQEAERILDEARGKAGRPAESSGPVGDVLMDAFSVFRKNNR